MVFACASSDNASRIHEDRLWCPEPASWGSFFFPATVAFGAEAVDPGLVCASRAFAEAWDDGQGPVFETVVPRKKPGVFFAVLV